MKLITEEQAAIAYEEATDGCRHSLLGTRANAQEWQRVKPDPETNPLADLDCERCRRGIIACRRLLLCERVRARDGDHSTSSLRVTKKPLRSGSCSIILRA